MKNILDEFSSCNIDSSVNEIKNWANKPELSKLLKTLKSVNKYQQFLDHWAEALIAGYLDKQKCMLYVEVPTVDNRTADLKVTKENQSFFIHVKRLNSDERIQKQSNIQSRLRTLERINKPFIVNIRFTQDLKDDQMQYFVNSGSKFIRSASIGDSKEIFDSNNKMLGSLKISRKNNKGHVLLISTSACFFIDEKRLYNKLSEAYRQFMPNSTNIIFITGQLCDIEDLDSILLGNTYEDHTVIPIQKGRKKNSFWSDNKHPDSYIFGWFDFVHKIESMKFKIFYRDNYKIPSLIKNLFNPIPTVG